MKVTAHTNLIGKIPKKIFNETISAIKGVPPSIWSDDHGRPLTTEVREFDHHIQSNMESVGLKVDSEQRVIDGSKFNCDIAIPELSLLIEIEKGKLPRIELDLMKFMAAHENDPAWEYGLLVVPTNHIKLTLAGRNFPYKYLQNLSPLANAAFAHSPISVGVIGYEDPRGDAQPA